MLSFAGRHEGRAGGRLPSPSCFQESQGHKGYGHCICVARLRRNSASARGCTLRITLRSCWRAQNLPSKRLLATGGWTGAVVPGLHGKTHRRRGCSSLICSVGLGCAAHRPAQAAVGAGRVAPAPPRRAGRRPGGGGCPGVSQHRCGPRWHWCCRVGCRACELQATGVGSLAVWLAAWPRTVWPLG